MSGTAATNLSFIYYLVKIHVITHVHVRTCTCTCVIICVCTPFVYCSLHDYIIVCLLAECVIKGIYNVYIIYSSTCTCNLIIVGVVIIIHTFVIQQGDYGQAEKYAQLAIEHDHYNPHGNVVINSYK